MMLVIGAKKIVLMALIFINCKKYRLQKHMNQRANDKAFYFYAMEGGL